jgi:hypothetical protein
MKMKRLLLMNELGRVSMLLLTLLPVGIAQTMNSISPDWASAGGPAFTLTINGTGFVSGSTIQWTTTTPTTLSVVGTITSTQIAASVPASLLTAGTANITVTKQRHGIERNNVHNSIAAGCKHRDLYRAGKQRASNNGCEPFISLWLCAGLLPDH